MLEILKYYAQCNAVINNTMMKVITESSKSPYDIQVEGYYKSIGEILDHYYKSDIIWVNALCSIRDFNIKNNHLLKVMPKRGERQFSTIEEYYEKRTELDNLIIDFVNELTDADMNKKIERKNAAGEKQIKVFWKAVIHMFNHETHHRGQISQILDSMKIENDYSNMIRINL